jgi:hypothetical protein
LILRVAENFVNVRNLLVIKTSFRIKVQKNISQLTNDHLIKTNIPRILFHIQKLLQVSQSFL